MNPRDSDDSAFPLQPQQMIVMARTNFATFVELIYPILHNGAPLKYADYIGFVCYALTACGTRAYRRFILNMPPGFMKSLLTSVLFVAWRLGVNPGEKFICASYGDDLAHKLGRLTRQVMQSSLYRAIFPHTVLIKTAEDFLETTGSGYRYATSVGSDIAGFRADIAIIDDPMQPDDAYSALAKQKVMDWYQGSVSQRLLADGVIIVVMHRLAPDDFCGTLEQTGNWDVIKLPLIAEEKLDYCDANGHVFWSVNPGDLLNPAYKNQTEVSRWRNEISSELFDAHCQQRPRYGATGECSIDRLVRYDKPPKFELTIHSWDIAATKAGGNYTVCTKFGLVAVPVKGDFLYMVGLIRMQVELPDVREAIITQDAVDKPALIVIDGAGIGKGVYQDLLRRGLKHVVTGSAAEQSNAADLKVKRFRAALPHLYDGKVLFPSAAPWLDTFFPELASFPEGKHKDQVDSMTQLVASMRTLIAYARQDRRNR